MKFIRKLFVYGIGNVSTRAISFLLIPIYTRYVQPEHYGKADLIYYTVAILVSTVFMEIWTALLRFSYDNREKESIEKVFSNTMAISFIMLIPFIILQLLVTNIIYPEISIYSVLYGVGLLFLQIYLFMTRAVNKSKVFVISGIVNSITQVISAVILVVLLKFQASVVILAPLIGTLSALVYIEIRCGFTKYFDISKVKLKFINQIIRFSIPLAFNSIAYWAIANFNKYYTVYAFGYEASGYISVINKITLVITLAGSIFGLAWQEAAFESSNDKNRGMYYKNMFGVYLSLFTFATALCIYIFNFTFDIIVGQDFINAKFLLIPSFYMTFFSGIAGFFGQIFNAEKKTKFLMYSTFTGFAVNLIVLLIFNNNIGLMVVPFASATSFLIVSLTRYIGVKKYVEFKLENIIIIKASVILLLSTVSNVYISNAYVLFTSMSIIILLSILVYKNDIFSLINTIKKERI